MKKYLANLQISLLFGDKGYQRELDQSKINQWSKNYKPDLLGVLIVSKRIDHNYYVIDGQHRLALLKLLGINFAPCLVMEGLSPEREAELFTEYEEKRNRQKPKDKFIARVYAGDPHVTKVSEILNNNGLEISRTSKDKANNCQVRCIVSISKMSEDYGYDVIDKALYLIRAAWPKDKHATEKCFLEAIAKFIILFGGNKNFTVARALQQFKLINPGDTVMRAKGMKLSGGTVDNIVNLLIDTYNQRLHTSNRLQRG